MSSKGVEAVEENRTHLEALAESSLPCDWIAKAILEAVDSTKHGGTTE